MCVWLIHISVSTTYIIMAAVAVVAVISWFIPKKPKKTAAA